MTAFSGSKHTIVMVASRPSQTLVYEILCGGEVSGLIRRAAGKRKGLVNRLEKAFPVIALVQGNHWERIYLGFFIWSDDLAFVTPALQVLLRLLHELGAFVIA